MGRTYQTLAPLADQTGHHCCVGLTRKALTELGWNDATIDLWIAEVPQIEVEDAVGWRSLGVGPETAAWYADVRPSIADEWLAHGFTVNEMVRCHRSRVTLVRALEWRSAGRPLDETVLWGSHGSRQPRLTSGGQAATTFARRTKLDGTLGCVTST